MSGLFRVKSGQTSNVLILALNMADINFDLEYEKIGDHEEGHG